MRRLWVVPLVLVLAGCAVAHCNSAGLPPGEQAYAAFGGSNVGNTLIAMGQMAGHAAGFMATPGTSAQPGCTIDYYVPPIFGSDYVNTGISAPAAPTTTNNFNAPVTQNMAPATH